MGVNYHSRLSEICSYTCVVTMFTAIDRKPNICVRYLLNSICEPVCKWCEKAVHEENTCRPDLSADVTASGSLNPINISDHRNDCKLDSVKSTMAKRIAC